MASDLLPGEKLVLKTHQHWVVLVKSLVIPVVLLVIALVVDVTVKSGTGIPHFRTVVTLVAIAIAGLWLIVVWIRWRATAYTLTDQRIKIEAGLFGRSAKTIPHRLLQGCATHQAGIGGMLGLRRGRCERAGPAAGEWSGHQT